MRHGLFLVDSIHIESLSQLAVLLILEIIHHGEVIRCRKVENGPAHIGLARPHAAHDAVHVVDLKEAMHFELGEVLKHGYAPYVLLLQHRLHLLWLVQILVDHDELLQDLFIDEVDSEDEAAELVAHLHQYVCGEDEPHERVRLPQDVSLWL